MSQGRSLAGPEPPLAELVRRAGVSPPVPATTARAVELGSIVPLVSDPKHSRAAQAAIANIEIARAAALRAAQTFAERAATVALSYTDYLDTVRNQKSILAEFEREARREYSLERYLVPFSKAEVFQFSANIFKRTLHTPDFMGYVNYVGALHPYYGACLARVPPPLLDEGTREQHTYISGSTGSGKTELLKALVFHDVSQRNATVIIDPMGKFARAVAMWPEFAGDGMKRLAYINPKLAPGMVPALNPLDARHLSRDDRGILASQLTDVLAQVVGKGEWTTQTETVAANCLHVAVNTKGATLRDLRLALAETDKKGARLPPMVARLIEFGKRHHIQEVQDFFTDDFLSTQYITSKGSLRAKLSHMLRDELFANITRQRSKIDLEALINDRKVIIFDLSAWGNDAAAGAFGRMVIAQLAAIGMRRSARYGEDHTPVHVFVDEADVFVGPAVLKILSKLRQHRVHLTLAQQTVGYGFEGADKHQLLSNTAIKFTAGDKQQEMLAFMNAPKDAAQGLAQGQFIGRWGRDGEPFRLDVRSDLLGRKRAMPPEDWAKVVAYQLAHYYTAPADQAEAAPRRQPGAAPIAERDPDPAPTRRL